jgi:hypothetical protein
MLFDKKIPFGLYLFINLLFLIKYSSRSYDDKTVLFGGVYLILIVGLVFFFKKKKLNEHFYKYTFWLVAIVFFFVTLLINLWVDGNGLNVDRWSAMDVGARALLENKYPYIQSDHMNGRTSNLPSLLFIGVPFRLIGDVGFIQSLCFVAFTYILFKSLDNYRDRLLGLLLLTFSVAYLWEIYVKSDLMSNFILLLLFIATFYDKINKQHQTNIGISMTSFFATSLLLTRLTVVIPLTLLLFNRFLKYYKWQKCLFLFVAVFTIVSFSYICFHNVASWEQFLKYNPIDLQNRQLPTALSFLFILLPFFLSGRVKNKMQLVTISFYLLFSSVAIAFILRCFKFGIYDVIFSSKFDISYFNMGMPFLIVMLASIQKANSNRC